MVLDKHQYWKWINEVTGEGKEEEEENKYLEAFYDMFIVKQGGSMPHSQGLSNNPYPESNEPSSSY